MPSSCEPELLWLQQVKALLDYQAASGIMESAMECMERCKLQRRLKLWVQRAAGLLEAVEDKIKELEDDDDEDDDDNDDES